MKKSNPYYVKKRYAFNFKKKPKEATISIFGILLIIIGIYIVIPALLPILKIIFGLLLITGGYFLVNKNSNLFIFRRI